eukprot:TRINITY_DN7195_c0_g1_i1.p1 TRINITY_DN7195_c0_g1~~TRINITY_DN7195_c0_g1_i1.p1  ORF type:complete len:566 (-),score=100.28 TRINITY_DN7195_c0_g1_i1:35-1732(-)
MEIRIHDSGSFPNQLLFGRFQLQEKIGGGSFGKIFKAIDRDTNEIVAAKLERRTHTGSTLSREARILSDLNDMFGFPKLVYSGKEETNNVLVMSYLGYDLEKLFKTCNYRFSLKTVLMIADQMLTRIEHLHSRGYLHRDIKPENFVMGINKTAKNLHLIDFGLSKAWRDSQTGKHIPYKENKGLVGTARYASLSTHMGVEQARRDDLESIGYVLIYFLKGKLPWQNLRCDSRSDKYAKIAEVKMRTPIETLCRDLPSEFSQYVNYVRNLGFADMPDYKFLKKIFRRYFLEHGYDFDYNYDWISNTKLIEDSLVKSPIRKIDRPPKAPAGEKKSGMAEDQAGKATDGRLRFPDPIPPLQPPDGERRREELPPLVNHMNITIPLKSESKLTVNEGKGHNGNPYHSGLGFELNKSGDGGNMLMVGNRPGYTIKVTEVEQLNLPVVPSFVEESYNSSKMINASRSNFEEEDPQVGRKDTAGGGIPVRAGSRNSLTNVIGLPPQIVVKGPDARPKTQSTVLQQRPPSPTETRPGHERRNTQDLSRGTKGIAGQEKSVSYTHLTLPTIYSV